MGSTASALLGGLESLWGEHSPFVMGEVILLGAMGFYLVAWLLVGWDRHKAAGGPKHEPPAGYSPAALRYLWSIEDCPIGYDDGCFTTAVVGLAGKGVVTIEQNGSTFLLHDRGVGTVELLSDEEIVYNALFHDASPGSDAPRGSLTLGQSGRRLYGQVFRAAIAGLQTQLDEQLKRGDGYRTNNRWWVWIGVLMSLFGAGLLNMDPTMLESRFATNVAESAAEISSGLNVELLVRGVFGGMVALFWALVIFLLYGSFILLRRRDMEPGLGLGFLGAAFGFMLVKLTLELYTGAGFFRVAGWMLFGYVLNARGANLLKRYSRKGRMVQDYIEGLQMYTGGEGKPDFKQAYAPEMNAEHHDQLLPYAVALGRAGNWSRQFESVLANQRESRPPPPGFLFDHPDVRKELALYYTSVPRADDAGSTLEVNGPFHEALNASC